jgi:putative addiction module killer protein
MIEVRRTAVFTAWLRGLRDERAKARIALRIDRLRLGNFGDVKPVGERISELRIFYGPGYRVYLTRRGATLVILLCGGDKSTQSSDVNAAKVLASQLGREKDDGN